MATTDVYEQIRKEILNCTLTPGEAIYEQELAKKFGLSKSPIREALLRLQEQNLVDVRARSGYRVRPISIAEAEEMYEMRHLFERACVARVIDHATDDQIKQLNRHLTKDARMSVRSWVALNRNFHSTLALISGNSCLAEAANRFIDRFDRFTIVSVTRIHQPIDWTHFNKEHSMLVNALLSRDKRTALSTIKSHIEGSRRRTIEALTDSRVVP